MQHFAGMKGKAQAQTTAHVETLSIEDKLKYASSTAKNRSARARPSAAWKSCWKKRLSVHAARLINTCCSTA
jgi:hypothetical protein